MVSLPLAKWLNCKASKIYPVCPNLELDFGDVKIKALFGRHKLQNGGFNDFTEYLENVDVCQKDKVMAQFQGIGSLEYRNFLVTTANGTKILVWGNDVTIEQINICKELKPDIAIIQRSSNEETHKQTAKFVKEIGCKVVIPHHHDFKKFDGDQCLIPLKEAIEKETPDVKFIFPKHGEWINL